MSSTAETRILCHIFLVCLHYEGYSSLDINLLQSDLSLNPKKTSEIVKSLGCRILTPKGADTEKIIAKWQNEGKTSSIPTSSSSRKVKIASLKIPLEFPRERKMAAKR
jgi:DNA-directed RNA polymerase I subunit RPA49